MLDHLYSKDELVHFGTPHQGNTPHSGRYAFGSGENAYERANDFLGLYRKYKAEGMDEKQIAEVMGYSSTTTLRNKLSIETNKEYSDRVREAKKLRNSYGYTYQKIADIMGLPNESSARTLCKASDERKKSAVEKTSDELVSQLKKHKYLDVGVGVELSLGVSKTNLDTAVAALKDEGYTVQNIYIDQVALKGQKTTVKVLAQPGVTVQELYKNSDKIGTVDSYSPDGGITFQHTEYPQSIDSKRVYVRYAEDGGAAKDGSIEIRPGVEDLSLGKSNYAQVRIALDDKYYLKGVAVYSNDIPKGYDIVVNSNKKSGTPIYDEEKGKGWAKKLETNKDGTINEDLPFGSLIKANGQYHYTDKDGNDRLGAINMIREEGDWNEWSKTLASQFLAKQNKDLIKRQLGETFKEKKEEYDEIMSLTNNTVKAKLLMEFAEGCDASAVNLKAKSLPGQLTKVLVPVDSLKDNECYAPNYPNGSRLCLVRYPHGGVFEIPELVVNNNNKEAKTKLGTNPKDAIGINVNVAGILSGADFDGDTVICIPTKTGNGVNIKTMNPLKDLEGFDPKEAYPHYEGMKRMSNTGNEMGKITNLITDMTIQGATEEELARAVKHSMVVIDAEKHYLDYKQSFEDQGISELKKKYQGGGGASTIFSQAKGTVRVDERTRSHTPNKETGEWEYTPTNRTYIDKNGKEVRAQIESTKMAEAKDAYDLVTGKSKETAFPQEIMYAEYANGCKALANKARKEAMNLPKDTRSATAAKTYAAEVESLDAKLINAQKNSYRERQAQIYANNKVKMMVAANPELKYDKDEYKKNCQYALAEGRLKCGANKKSVQVQITDKEWEAIQAKAVSPTKLGEILKNTDMDVVKQLATPRATNELSTTKQNRIAALKGSGKTIAEIAEIVGCSTSTVSKYM